MQKLIDTMRNYGFSNEVIAGVLGNIKAECNFELKAENMYYTKIETLLRVFPSKFKNMDLKEVETYIKNPEKLGNLVYESLAQEKINGKIVQRSGYKYRGRGYIQITGLDNYKAYGQLLKLDLVNNPDLALREDIAVLIAIEYIKNTTLSKYPSLNEIRDINTVADIITKSIQGFGKNYTTGFLKEHLEKKREYAKKYFKELQIQEIIGG